jgi:putative FmdB family regulatory protein
MPIYQYKCSNEHQYEEERSITSKERTITCPNCEEVMKRVYFSPAVNLVGRGFYRNGG